MRPFQAAAKAAIEKLLRGWIIQLDWEERRIGPHAAMDSAPDDVDLRTRLEIGGERYEIWIHPDDLSLKTPGINRILESQDFRDDPNGEIEAFCDLIRARLPTRSRM